MESWIEAAGSDDNGDEEEEETREGIVFLASKLGKH
ncbi:hypothetical protein COLO4_09543 [Corchorus olitorius]|uniref:Uncharacterized protein n=1 Tax=Corchorus olitorius TaxID=93759 RepID=A0A1R3KBX0_9ROSI|nr:hypothetical protein COLO4_09543 [Corchorus olitorius]